MTSAPRPQLVPRPRSTSASASARPRPRVRASAGLRWCPFFVGLLAVVLAWAVAIGVAYAIARLIRWAIG